MVVVVTVVVEMINQYGRGPSFAVAFIVECAHGHPGATRTECSLANDDDDYGTIYLRIGHHCHHET